MSDAAPKRPAKPKARKPRAEAPNLDFDFPMRAASATMAGRDPFSAEGLFPEPGPRVFNAPAGLPFPKAMAEGVLARLRACGADPAALSDVEIIVSTQRAARSLRAAFVEAADGVALGPRLYTLGDIGADLSLPCDAPPPIDKMRRLMLLTRLTRALLESAPELGAPAVAAPLAADLAALLESAQAAGVSLNGLEAFEEDRYAAHWSLSRKFLELIREVWPTILEQEGRIDPEDRRRRVVAALAERWADAPPTRPVIVAGSTGSLDTSAWFISLVAALPQGAVVLPGFDGGMDKRAAAELLAGRAPEHPQSGLFNLCQRLGVAPGDVKPWAEDPRPHAAPRLHWLSQAMRPAPVTDAWRADLDKLRADAEAATANLTLLEADTPREEAAAIALALREALETPDLHAALITPDRTLARRVATELKRWNIEPDDSGGRPLSLTAPGVFFSLTAEAALSWPKPESLLALLKHPLAAAGFERGQHLRATRTLERKVLRANRLGGARDIASALAEIDRLQAERAKESDSPSDQDGPTLSEWWAQVEKQLAPLIAMGAEETVDLEELVAAHGAAAAALSRVAGKPAAELYQKAAGETLQGFLQKVRAAAVGFGPLAPPEYPALIGQLMSGEAVREAFGRHPRIAILGPLEARMQSAELVILAGLNEGVWPQIPQPDAWLSRDMRAQLGLPPLESRVGLSAHDFFQAAMAETVILSRARRSDGSPTVPSRWLLRLTTLLTGVAPETLDAMSTRGAARLALAKRLDLPEERLAPEARARLTPAPRPTPRPPLEARPRRLSATEVETLIRDPYAVYARRVLGLRALSPLAETPDARDRGDLLHRIVERHVKETPEDESRESSAARFDALAAEILTPIAHWPTLYALWSARAHNLRDWFLDGEARRREEGAAVALEARGLLALDTRLGEVTLSAQADRIDRLFSGGYAIYDYKTGAPPSEKEVAAFAKQLPLEAAILAKAGFEGVEQGRVDKVGYLQLAGGRKGGKEQSFNEAMALAEAALDGLLKLLASYADPEQPYPARARPKIIKFASDYDHLSRYGEWTDGV